MTLHLIHSWSLGVALIAILSIETGPTSGSAAVADDRPNLVMIFTDDQRHDAAGFNGNPHIHTPNLDRLARQGCVFDNCFVNTSICSISRANLITGQYPARHGVDDFFKTLDDKALSRSVPGRLRDAGYQTMLVGKWGIGDTPAATRRGAIVFDYWAGQPMQTCFFHDRQCAHVVADGFTQPGALCDCPADAQGRRGFRNRIGTHGLTDPVHEDSDVTPMHVRRFLEGRDTSKPFCLMLFFKSPHSPYGDWDRSLKGLTDGKTLAKPAAATLANADGEPEMIRRSLGAPSGRRMLDRPQEFDAHLRDYYRLVASMDLGVGRVIDALRDHAVQENTVVCMTSDNGHFLAEHGLMGKWLMYEPSLRVPGFLYDPRPGAAATRGTRREELVITTDFSATMLALAGLDVPADVSGRDLTPLVRNTPNPWRRDFYYDHPYRHRGEIPATIGVRDANHVYTRYIDEEPLFEQLFDLRSDPDQLDNLATDPVHHDRLNAMRKRCDELAAEVR